jgi:hypothetical protein
VQERQSRAKELLALVGLQVRSTAAPKPQKQKQNHSESSPR